MKYLIAVLSVLVVMLVAGSHAQGKKLHDQQKALDLIVRELDEERDVHTALTATFGNINTSIHTINEANEINNRRIARLEDSVWPKTVRLR